MNARRGVGIGLLLACGTAAADEWQLDAGLRHSQWREWDARGALLLQERGPLAVVGLTGIRQAAGFDLSLRVEAAGGSRDYEGRTNRGAPLSTDVDVREGSVAFGFGWPAGGAWQWRGALQPTGLSRSLNSNAGAVGYTERWRWIRGGLGLHWQQPVGAGALEWHVDTVAALDAQLRLTLPGADPATLRPRNGRGWQGGVAWQAPLSADWSWRLALQRDRLRFDASEAVPLMRAGVLQGGLQQPRTQIDNWGLRLGFERRWG